MIRCSTSGRGSTASRCVGARASSVPRTSTPDVPLVLVWPDPAQTDAAIQTLLTDITDDVIVAAWDPAGEDGGRTELLTSVRDARDALVARGADPDELTLIGFGLGATAAAGLA